MKQPKKHKRLLSPDAIQIIRRIVGGVLAFGFAGAIIAGVWYGTRVESLTVKEVEVSGGETISHQEVRSKALAFLDGEYLGLVPRAFAWTYPKGEILEELSKIERIKDITITRNGGETLHVSFSEFIPRALWCDRELPPRCQFLDQSGYAFAPAPNLTGGSFLRFVSSEEKVDVGTSPFTLEDFDTAQQLTVLLHEHGWLVYEIEIDAAHDAYVAIVDGSELKVSLLESPTKTVENFLTIISSDQFSHLEVDGFEYIDLRFGNKVFVKEESEELATTTEQAIEEITE